MEPEAKMVSLITHKINEIEKSLELIIADIPALF